MLEYTSNSIPFRAEFENLVKEQVPSSLTKFRDGENKTRKVQPRVFSAMPKMLKNLQIIVKFLELVPPNVDVDTGWNAYCLFSDQKWPPVSVREFVIEVLLACFICILDLAGLLTDSK